MQRNSYCKGKKWEDIRQAVFKLDHYECVRCNHTLFDKKGNKTRTIPTVAHHIYEVSKFPQYQHQIWVNGKRNIVSLCRNCHEELHGRKFNPSLHFTNEERWD